MRKIRETLLLFCIIFLFSSVACAGLFEGPSDYDECILENMKGVASDLGARLIQQSCQKKFPKQTPESESDESPRISDGANVTIEYTLTLPDGTEVDSNVGKEPLAFTQGTGQLISGLERQLVGMKAGDDAVIFVAATEAYGEYDPEKKMTVNKKKMPPDIQVGSHPAGPGGQPVTVTEVTDTSVTVDTNHPLAGKDLMFDIRVLTVEP